jgi:hypothetical protein
VIASTENTIEEMAETLLERLIEVVSGALRTKAELLGQDDFIPWKRGVSLRWDAAIAVDVMRDLASSKLWPALAVVTAL